MNKTENIESKILNLLFSLSLHASKLPRWGVLCGLLFPLIAWIIDININNLKFSLTDIGNIHISNPVHFIIDCIPLIIGLILFGLSKIIETDRKQFMENIDEKDQIINMRR